MSGIQRVNGAAARKKRELHSIDGTDNKKGTKFLKKTTKLYLILILHYVQVSGLGYAPARAQVRHEREIVRLKRE